MALLPIYKDEMLFDGSYIHALPFCLKNCKNDKCLAHYRNMISKTTGFYTCPYGLSTFLKMIFCKLGYERQPQACMMKKA